MPQLYRLIGGPFHGRTVDFLPTDYVSTGSGHAGSEYNGVIPFTAEYRDNGMDAWMREVIDADNELTRVSESRGIRWEEPLVEIDPSDTELLSAVARMRRANARQRAWLDAHIQDR